MGSKAALSILGREDSRGPRGPRGHREAEKTLVRGAQEAEHFPMQRLGFGNARFHERCPANSFLRLKRASLTPRRLRCLPAKLLPPEAEILTLRPLMWSAPHFKSSCPFAPLKRRIRLQPPLRRNSVVGPKRQVLEGWRGGTPRFEIPPNLGRPARQFGRSTVKSIQAGETAQHLQTDF
jgi:hypothetical protein